MTRAQRRRLALASTLALADPAEVLRGEITALCAQADLRLGRPPGTAERGLFFHYWPPESVHDPDVLAQLHADAVEFLFAIINPKDRFHE